MRVPFNKLQIEENKYNRLQYHLKEKHQSLTKSETWTPIKFLWHDAQGATLNFILPQTSSMSWSSYFHILLICSVSTIIIIKRELG